MADRTASAKNDGDVDHAVSSCSPAQVFNAAGPRLNRVRVSNGQEDTVVCSHASTAMIYTLQGFGVRWLHNTVALSGVVALLAVVLATEWPLGVFGN